MKAGKELDLLIHEKVMGKHPRFWGGAHLGFPSVPAYSTNMASAWEVVKSYQGRARFALYLTEMPTEYEAVLVIHLGMGDFLEYKATASTGPLAICLAAMQSVGKR